MYKPNVFVNHPTVVEMLHSQSEHVKLLVAQEEKSVSLNDYNSSSTNSNVCTKFCSNMSDIKLVKQKTANQH